MNAKLPGILCLLLLPLSLPAASPAFAPIFNRGAVLQCEMPANVWDTARLAGPSNVEITCAQVSSPVVIRYAWRPWPRPPVTLQNSDGLPAEPAEIRLP